LGGTGPARSRRTSFLARACRRLLHSGIAGPSTQAGLPPGQQVTFLGRCLPAYRWRFLPSGFNETACQTLLTVILEADTHTNRLANAARGLCRSVLPEGRATLRRRCPCFPFASQPLEAKSVGLLIVCPLPKEGWLLTSLLSGFFRDRHVRSAGR
jgi:hypothetical protein